GGPRGRLKPVADRLPLSLRARELDVKARVVASALAIAAIASCSPADGTHAAGGTHAAARPRTVSVTCTDSKADAANLQAAINSSAPGAAIEIKGTCLLKKGISLLGDRTYAGENTTGTVLKQAAGMRYVLSSAAYVGNSS